MFLTDRFHSTTGSFRVPGVDIDVSVSPGGYTITRRHWNREIAPTDGRVVGVWLCFHHTIVERAGDVLRRDLTVNRVSADHDAYEVHSWEWDVWEGMKYGNICRKCGTRLLDDERDSRVCTDCTNPVL